MQRGNVFSARPLSARWKLIRRNRQPNQQRSRGGRGVKRCEEFSVNDQALEHGPGQVVGAH